MMVIVILVNVGMWFERFVITVTSLSQRFLTIKLGLLHTHNCMILEFYSEVLDYSSHLVILFTKSLPVVSISEVKAVADGAQPSHNGGADHE